MIAEHNWIGLGSPTRPVDGINMDQVTAFIANGSGGNVLLYIGWTPESKAPWIRLEGEDAQLVIRWLAERGLVSVQGG